MTKTMEKETEELARAYIQKYAKKHKKTFEEAKEDMMCQLVSSFYGCNGEEIAQIKTP